MKVSLDSVPMLDLRSLHRSSQAARERVRARKACASDYGLREFATDAAGLLFLAALGYVVCLLTLALSAR